MILLGTITARIFRPQTIPILLAAFLSGCASFSGYPDPPQSADAELSSLDGYFAPSVIATYEALPNETARRAYRDEVTYARLRAYDIEFREFEKALSEESGTTGLGADLATLALNGLGATLGGASAKAAMAAASAGVIGAKGAIDKDLFYSKALPAITAQMEAGRLQVRATIEAGLGKSDADYSLPLAIVDLGSYERAGSLPGALNAITGDAGTKSAQADEDIKFTRDATFSGSLNSASALLARVKALTAAQALAVAKAMEPQLSARSPAIQGLVNGMDPSGARLKHGTSAKQVLMAWVIEDDRDATSQQQWSDALTAATK